MRVSVWKALFSVKSSCSHSYVSLKWHQCEVQSCLTFAPLPTSSLSPGCLIVLPWISGHRLNQIWWNNQSDQHIRILKESHHPKQDNYSSWTEPKKRDRQNHRTLKGPYRAAPFYVCWRDCLQLPCPSSHFPRLTESLKGLHRPPLPLQLKWPFASLTRSGPCRPPAAGLPSCIWIQACQSLVSSPPMALTGERRESRAEWGVSEGRKEGDHTRKKEGDDEDEETDAWRIVELQKLALRNRLVHYLVGLSSHNRTPTRWPLIKDWVPVCFFLIVPASVLHLSTAIWLIIIKSKSPKNAF